MNRERRLKEWKGQEVVRMKKIKGNRNNSRRMNKSRGIS